MYAKLKLSLFKGTLPSKRFIELKLSTPTFLCCLIIFKAVIAYTSTRLLRKYFCQNLFFEIKLLQNFAGQLFD